MRISAAPPAYWIFSTPSAAIAPLSSPTARPWPTTCSRLSSYAKPWAQGICHDENHEAGDVHGSPGKCRRRENREAIQCAKGPMADPHNYGGCRSGNSSVNILQSSRDGRSEERRVG